MVEKLSIKKNYHGFLLQNIEDIKEISSKACFFEHEKTKAKLLFIENDDDDKTFTITFRTPPYDNTGLPHILEHSVLCGSKNYPLKDTFATVAKSTINSFINAFTFPDKTMYPFSTTNEEEMKKLMRVYLDATFHPNIYDKEEIFLQEGWRFELENKEAPLKYSGVVYGEMRGALSSPNRILDSYSQRELFPDNSYGVESGGDPKNIPELTYEKFIDFHRKYYHPSNSYIYLHGNIDILEKLKVINEEFLEGFDYLEIDSTIKSQKSFDKPKEKEIKYPISKNENKDNKYLFGQDYVLEKATNSKTMLGLDILGSILMDYESSPLKKALIDADIAEDIYGGFGEDIIYQPIFQLVAQNAQLEKKEKFTNIIEITLKELTEKGIDKDLIEAAINKKEFQLREEEFYEDMVPKGIAISIKVMDSWLYEGEPLTHIKYSKNLKEIKEENGYFEKLITKYLIENKHKLLLTLVPEPGLDYEKEVAKKLEEIKNNMSEKQIEEIIEKNKKVKEFQEKEDSKDEIDKIKTLEKKFIDKEPKCREFEEKEIENIKILNHKEDTKGIDYLNFAFDVTHIPQEDIKYLSLISAILYELKTKNYKYDEFSNLINKNTGKLEFELKAFENKKGEFSAKLFVETKALNEKYENLKTILEEIFNNAVFEEKKIKEIVKKLKARYESSLISAGHMYAIIRVQSYISTEGAYNENTRGIEYYKFLKEIDKNFENKKDDIIKKLNDVYSKIFNKQNLIVSIASDNFDLKKLAEIKINKSNFNKKNYKFELENKNEAFIVQSQVNYVAQGYDLNLLGFESQGADNVLRNILRYDYLWDNIRLKGGAYGALAVINKIGSFYLCSYRDPNIKKTYEVYQNLPKFLENLAYDEEEIQRHIIGAISVLDKPQKIEDEAIIRLIEYIRDINYEDLKKERGEIINTDIKKLKELAEKTKAAIEKNYISTIGNEKTIEENKDKFKKIRHITE